MAWCMRGVRACVRAWAASGGGSVGGGGLGPEIEQTFGFPESGETPLPCNIEQTFDSDAHQRGTYVRSAESHTEPF